MDITCYLPDELGKLAKDAGLPLSRILRSGVLEALGMENPVVKPSSIKARLDAIEARLHELEQVVSPVEDEDDAIHPGIGPMDVPNDFGNFTHDFSAGEFCSRCGIHKARESMVCTT